MDPETPSPTEVGPDVAPSSVEKPTTEPTSEPRPDIAADDATDFAQTIAEISMELNSDVESQQASQSTTESTSKAFAKSPSAAEIPLPPSPQLLPGFRYSSVFPRLIVPIERSFVSDLRTSFDDGTLRATEAPVVATEDSAAALSDDDTSSYCTAPDHRSDDDTDDKIPNSNPVYRIGRFQNRDFSEQQHAIINALSIALRCDCCVDDRWEAAKKIDSLCPPSDQEENVEDWLWVLWEILIDIARFGEDTAVSPMCDVVSRLHSHHARGYVKIGGEERRLWKDLPMFSFCMDAAFGSDPTTGYTKLTLAGSRVWKQLNRFGAGCLMRAIGGPHHHALNAMRSALEEDTSPDIDIAECRMFVIFEWALPPALKALLRWALENVGADHPKEDSMDYEEPGPLYHGPPMMCLQRWGFWIERLEQLSKCDPESPREDLEAFLKDLQTGLFRRLAKAVAESMKEAEKELGHTLSD
ncbi:hypothetical protein CcaCcLH18_06465 [Colletotrichum camelliae]|nr:hypothetical protein CcaCcLH18_06465 [Colletotrichum camelliae]